MSYLSGQLITGTLTAIPWRGNPSRWTFRLG